jgi:hypothetical protein
VVEINFGPIRFVVRRQDSAARRPGSYAAAADRQEELQRSLCDLREQGVATDPSAATGCAPGVSRGRGLDRAGRTEVVQRKARWTPDISRNYHAYASGLYFQPHSGNNG